MSDGGFILFVIATLVTYFLHHFYKPVNHQQLQQQQLQQQQKQQQLQQQQKQQQLQQQKQHQHCQLPQHGSRSELSKSNNAGWFRSKR